MTGFRLPSGGRIDRSRRLAFTVDGTAFAGHPGDTLASALLAEGRTVMGRSFKYHRPRGPATAGAAEPNALMTVGDGGRREPNVRATVQELYGGLRAETQNRWPSLAFDVGAVNGLLSPFLSAGFYYKTFMAPRGLWERVYEPLIRRAAGLGRAGVEADPDPYDKRWAHCDLLVVGAGPAGLSAALTAARAGASVILADEQSEPGGTLLHETATVAGVAADAFLADALAELAALGTVRVLARTTVFGWYDDMVFGAAERVARHVAAPPAGAPVERLWRIAARRALLCTGAEERPIVFAGNDRPGVMTAEAAVVYARRYGVAVGERVAVFAPGEAGRRTARTLAGAGVTVAAVIDPAQDAAVIEARGRHALSALRVRRGTGVETVAADALAVCGGYAPRIHLACQRGAKPRWDERIGAFLAPGDTLPAAGSAAGATTLAACLATGAAAARDLLADLGLAAAAAPPPAVEDDHDERPVRAPARIPGGRGKAFVDFQNDVTAADLGLAVREGYDHVELAKRYTTAGMATDQGKLGTLNAVAILAEARGTTPAAVGTPTFRPFYTPVAFGTLAGPATGRRFQPVRRSPLGDWAERHGAVFVDAGLWKRASHFPRAGETGWRETVDREVRTVRAVGGVTDVSTLGKIEVVGPDAGAFLDRVYANAVGSLPVGRARYGLMLREDGFVFDDGTVSRLGDDRWFVTTTTAMAAAVLAHLEFCDQVLFPGFDVRFTSVSDQWATIAVAGPRSRDILAAVVDGDVCDAAVPHLAARAVTLFGGALSGLLFRLSFSGERAYELAVPAGFGDGVAEALLRAGAALGACAYGVEALGVLRIEKGHVTHNEINGTVTAADLGLGGLVSRRKADFVGRRMLAREGLADPARPRLVGLLPLDPTDGFRTGAHVLAAGAAATLENDQGYVTSSCHSPHVGSAIGLALVVSGAERHGEEVAVVDPLAGRTVRARLVAPAFVDPTHGRLHG